MKLDLAPLIVAITGLLAVIAGIRTSMQGRRDGNRQAVAADRAAEREQSWRERAEIITDLGAQLDRCRQDREWQEARADDAEADLDLLRTLARVHEAWDADRLADQPDAPPAPPLRPPRPRPATD